MSTPDDHERDHHFFSVLGVAVEAARLGQLCIRVELEDGTTVQAVPTASPYSERENVTEVDDSGVREDLELGDTVVMTRRVVGFTVDRPEPRSE